MWRWLTKCAADTTASVCISPAAMAVAGVPFEVSVTIAFLRFSRLFRLA
jgi:hypothetical protein